MHELFSQWIQKYLYENVRKVKFFEFSYFIENYEYYILQMWSMEIAKQNYWGGFNPELYPKKICVDEKLNPQNSNTLRIWCLVTIISHSL